MERLKKIGKITPKSSLDVSSSRIGLGFEKLDRDVFDPEKAYDKVGDLGVKWIRIQSGWQRTEREKGVYNFDWIDSVVDNLIARGLCPWICLCYGNDLYSEAARSVFGGVGCPPIFTDEEKTAWYNYVKATVEHFKGRVTHYEVWNEPDGKWCWKHGVNATELSALTCATAKAIKEADPDAKVIGGSLCLRPIAFINQALASGMAEYIDYITFHEYTADESLVFERVAALRAIAKQYNPNIDIIQGESGSQSKRGGHGALREGGWTPEKQAKQLARHTVADLISGVYFTSYFSCMDMVEALGGRPDDVSSYLDYGYFGVLGADFDEKGRSVGTYTPKPSYYVLQNIASIFADEFENYDMPVIALPQYAPETYAMDLKFKELTLGAFKRDGGEILAYWTPTNIMTTSYMGTASFEIFSKYDSVRLIDAMSGEIFDIPAEIVKRDEYGMFSFTHLPVKDTPLLLEFGNFIKE